MKAKLEGQKCSGWIGIPLVFVLSLLASSWMLTFFMALHMKRSVEEEICYLQAHYVAEGYVSCLLAGVNAGFSLEDLVGQEWTEGEYTISIGRNELAQPVEVGYRSWKLLVWEKKYQLSVVYILVVETKDGKTRFIRLERG